MISSRIPRLAIPFLCWLTWVLSLFVAAIVVAGEWPSFRLRLTLLWIEEGAGPESIAEGVAVLREAGPEALPVVACALREADGKRRAVLARILGDAGVGGERMLYQVAQEMEESSSVPALEALAKMPGSDATEFLLRCLDLRDRRLAAHAAEAVRVRGLDVTTRRLAAAFGGMGPTGQEAIVSLLQGRRADGEKVLVDLIDALAENDSPGDLTHRVTLVSWLLDGAPPDMPAGDVDDLAGRVAALASRAPREQRILLVGLLGRLGGEDACRFVGKMMEEARTDSLFYSAAVAALCRAGGDVALRPLFLALARADAIRRPGVLRALESVQADGFEEALAAAWQDPSLADAASALGQLTGRRGAERSLIGLLRCLGDDRLPAEDVRRAAQPVLARLPVRKAAMCLMEGLASASGDHVGWFSENLERLTVHFLDDRETTRGPIALRETWLRWWAEHREEDPDTWRESERQRVLSDLAAATALEDRRLAMERLYRLGGPEACKVFVDALGDGDMSIADGAENYLIQWTGEVLLGLLEEALRGPEGQARRAARLLGMREVPRADALLAAARRPEESVRSEAIKALGATRDGAAIPLLLETLLLGPEEDSASAARALERRQDPGLASRILSGLADGPAYRRRNVAWLLGRLGDPSAAPGLYRVLADPSFALRRAATDSLAMIFQVGDPPPLSTDRTELQRAWAEILRERGVVVIDE